MRIKLKDPKRVYYDRERKVTLTGDKVFSGIKVTQFIRGQLNIGSLIEVAEPETETETETETESVVELEKKKASALAKKKADALAKKVEIA